MSGTMIANLMAAGFPILLLWLKLGAAFSGMAKRKGVNTNLALIGAFPLWALLFAVWLMTRKNLVADEPDDPVPEEGNV